MAIIPADIVEVIPPVQLCEKKELPTVALPQAGLLANAQEGPAIQNIYFVPRNVRDTRHGRRFQSPRNRPRTGSHRSGRAEVGRVAW